ncbi:MAG: hypothetical protein HC903_18650 [Methylacidiphilales bacterium]|nr:hypothetical protein [Candidatus Methylacidiphilales bacterium]NJR14570.1 hypothetical protein [Calothrix sp. CSU_2_0]
MNIYFSDSSDINEWTEWHLTSRGWEQGNQKREDSPFVNKLKAPIDRILTCRYHETLSTNSVWMQKHTNEVWKISDKKVLTQMLEKFGSCPQYL